MNEELKELNFNSLLVLDTDVSRYDFNTYLENGKQHKIKGFCTKCEEKNLHESIDDNRFILQTMSHALMSDDVIIASNEKINDTDNWKDDGVLFIMESPSNIYNDYLPIIYNGYKKYPISTWYLFEGKHEKYEYPECFTGNQYWGLFNSIIFTFKLRNAYLTNFTKCGLNDEEGYFQRFISCNPECIKNCFNEYLKKEIDILKPKVIFCFGSTTIDYLQNYLREIYSEIFPFVIVLLPHPGHRMMKYEYFECIYFNKILEGLYRSKIYSLEETIKKYKYYLEINKNSNAT